MLDELVLVVGLMMAMILVAAEVVFSTSGGEREAFVGFMTLNRYLPVRDAQMVEHLVLGVEYHKTGTALQF